jgi:hypothetical protein
MVFARLQQQFRSAALAFALTATAVLVPKAAISAVVDCCSDLEARIAALEATVVGKGNRKVNVEMAGAVSRAILSWDDGQNTDSHVVTNDGEGSKIEITGEVEHFNRANWSAGFHIEINVQGAGSGEVNQFDDNIPTALQIDESQMWMRHRKAGQLTWGFVGGTGENIEDLTENDLSDTATAGYSGVEDIGGGFFLRRSNVRGVPGLLTPVVWGDLINHLPGIDGSIVRYDTPMYRGFEANATWGEDDQWQLALNWTSAPEKDSEENPELAEIEPMEDAGAYPAQTGLLKIFQISGTVGLFDIRDVLVDEPDSRTAAGSLSILHKPSGLSLTGAAARRTFTGSQRFNDDEVGRPSDPWYYYLKAGWKRDLNRLGQTAFFAEYGNFNQFLGRDADEEQVAALGGIEENAVCGNARSACLVSGSKATIWGFGVVQYVKDADLQLYTAYRHYEPDVSLSSIRGGGVRSVPLDDFQTVITGALKSIFEASRYRKQLPARLFFRRILGPLLLALIDNQRGRQEIREAYKAFFGLLLRCVSTVSGG